MGDAYQLPDNGTSTGNLYGVAWSHPNAGGAASNLNDHGMLILLNGTFKAAISSRAVFTNEVRGTLFRDYNSSGYYLDPASTSNLNVVNANTFNGTFNGTLTGTAQNANHLNTTRDTPGNSLQYWQASGLGITEAPTTDWHNTIRMGHGSPLSYYSNTLAIRMTGSNVGDIYTQTIQSGNRQGWKRHWNDGIAINSTYDISAPIFYDINNTGYYVNAASTSRFSRIDFGNSSYYIHAGSWGMRNTTPYGYIEFGPANSGHAHIYTSMSNFYFNKMIQVLGGSQMNQNDVRGNIFYTKNNTAYYIDGDGQSRLNTLTLVGNRIGFVNTSFDAEIRVSDANPNGTGAEFVFYGDTLAGHAQLTAKVGNFTSNVRTPIMYDSNDTSYYINAASDSRLNGKLQVDGGHGDSQIGVRLPAASNGAGTGDVNLQMWVRNQVILGIGLDLDITLVIVLMVVVVHTTLVDIILHMDRGI